jgi:predicted permease
MRPRWRGSREDRDLDDELRDYIARRTAQKIRDGLSPDLARRTALAESGGLEPIKEAMRDARLAHRIAEPLRDLRYAWRMARRSPGFAAVTVVSLALAIGANITIFSVTNALLLRRLPVEDADSLVMFRKDDPTPRAAFFRYTFNYPEFERYRTESSGFSGLAAVGVFDRAGLAIAAPDSRRVTPDPNPVRVSVVSGSYFDVLGVTPGIGRVFTDRDDTIAGGRAVAIVSDAYWRRRMNGTPDVLDYALLLNGITYAIVGVARAGFSGDWVGRPVDVWVPAAMYGRVLPEAPGPGLTRFGARIVARLRPGITRQQAEASAQAVMRRSMTTDFGPAPTAEQSSYVDRTRLRLLPASAGFSPDRESFGPVLAILSGMAALLLAIACANVATLLLTRAAARRTEIALRLSIGASRARVFRQLLTESLVLACLAGALGFVLSTWVTTAVSTFSLGPLQLDARAAPPSLSLDLLPDRHVVVFTFGICLFTAVVFGIAPAVRGVRLPLFSALRDQRGASGPRRLGSARTFVVVQVALSVLVLAGAGLFGRTLRNLRSLDLGVDRAHVLLVWTSPGQTGRRGADLAALCRVVLDRLATVPGVVSASASNRGVLTGNDGGLPSEMMIVPGHPPKAGQFTSASAIAPGYFLTIGAPMLAGRDFTDRDTETGPPVAIVNETFARFFYGNASTIGQRFATPGGAGRPYEIVGVARDAQHGSPQVHRAMKYFPYRQQSGLMRDMNVVIRTAGPPKAIAGRIRETLHVVEPGLPVFRIDTIEEQLDAVLAQERLVAAIATAAGLLVTALACIGLYGVVAYSVSQRTNEIGIRLTLGARPSAVAAMMLRESLTLVGIGMAIGIALTLASARLVVNRLFGVSPADVPTLAAAAVLLGAVALAAAGLPARRASRVDPMTALRCD